VDHARQLPDTLVFSRDGVVRCFALKDVESGTPTRTLDLEGL